jgi:hypothetical protein
MRSCSLWAINTAAPLPAVSPDVAEHVLSPWDPTLSRIGNDVARDRDAKARAQVRRA